MNKADSNIMETLLNESGMLSCEKEDLADVIIMNTCSVREHAESRVIIIDMVYYQIWNRLEQFRNLDKKYKKHTVMIIFYIHYRFYVFQVAWHLDWKRDYCRQELM